MKRSKTKTTAALLTTVATAMNLLGIGPAFAQTPAAAQPNPAAPEPTLTLATSTGTAGSAQAAIIADQSSLTTAQKIALLRQKVKYVFVLFQENRSFDHYFGTYPGANGLLSTYTGANPADPYSQPANTFSSFNSVIQNVDGSFSTISPFLIPRIDRESGRRDGAALPRGHLLGRSQPCRLHQRLARRRGDQVDHAERRLPARSGGPALRDRQFGRVGDHLEREQRRADGASRRCRPSRRARW